MSAFGVKRTWLGHRLPLPISQFEPVRCLVLNLGAAMKRREFVALFGGAVAWPFAARAQQKQAHRVGVLSQDMQPGLLEAFREELHKLGYVEGSDVSIELRNAAGHNARLFALKRRAGRWLRAGCPMTRLLTAPGCFKSCVSTI
jgi:hypothetical protein